MAESCTATAVFMDTLVSIEVVHSAVADDCSDPVERAFEWFREVEQRCSRFDPVSELVRLCGHVGEPVEVTPLLYRAIEFAVAVAEASGGAFDPTIGRRLEAAGFNENYRTGERSGSGTGPTPTSTYRDILLDPPRRTVMFRRPTLLDLGAVAKGLAIDLAAQELRPFGNFAINAGGDLFVQGSNAAGEPWTVGIRHPREDDAMFETLHLSDFAVCTSGDYERRRSDAEQGHHILEPKTGHSAGQTVSATVIAPTAMAADALATAAFVLGPAEGLAFLERQGVEGLIVSASLARFDTPGLSRYLGTG
jgi:thiamine biosynthesis lipoprotein